MQKKCTKCNKTKKLDMFSVDNCKKDKHKSICKECDKAHNKYYRTNAGITKTLSPDEEYEAIEKSIIRQSGGTRYYTTDEKLKEKNYNKNVKNKVKKEYELVTTFNGKEYKKEYIGYYYGGTSDIIGIRKSGLTPEQIKKTKRVRFSSENFFHHY
jgi:hypothetical protein